MTTSNRDIEKELQKRRKYRMDSMKEADNIVKMADAQGEARQPVGCFALLIRALSRKHTKLNREDILTHADVTMFRERMNAFGSVNGSVSRTTQSRTTMSTRLFGQSKRAAHTNVQHEHSSLDNAQLAIERKLSLTQAKMDELKSQAKREHTTGNVAAALRLMKRAKACERQLTTLTNASTAIERQAEMIEEASLQREVATAIAGSMNDMKGAKKLLEGMDKLSDDVAEMRDVSEDIQQALASIADSSADHQIDDDDLLAELDAMQTSKNETEQPALQTSTRPQVDLHLPAAPSLLSYPTAPMSAVAGSDSTRREFARTQLLAQ